MSSVMSGICFKLFQIWGKDAGKHVVVKMKQN